MEDLCGETPQQAPLCDPFVWRVRQGGVKQSTFCMVHRKTMITMGSPYFEWINTNEIISSWYLLGAVCVTPPGVASPFCVDNGANTRYNVLPYGRWSL
jgi:hypothetical protein